MALAKAAEADLQKAGYDARVQIQPLLRPLHITLLVAISVGIAWIFFF
ncbi:MAG: hypothetical protein H0U23_15770 [Blastocatellia bacterium]|nr:hypothetical protein [Blastocatellia bacterium]